MTVSLDQYANNPSTGEERVKVRIQMINGNEIKGYIYLEGTSFERRVSSLFNDTRLFVPVTDAELYQGGKKLSTTPFVCLNKQAIAMVYEEQ